MKNLNAFRKILPIASFAAVSLFLAFQSCSGWSEVRNVKPIPQFTVPPKDSDLRYAQFIAVGDMGTGGSGQAEVAAAMTRKAEQDSISFVLILGDNFYESGVRSVQDAQWQTKFEKMYWQPCLQVPFYAVLGNHDYRQNPQAQVEYTRIGTRWKMPARYYTFVHPIDDSTNIQFFCLDTYPLSKGALDEDSWSPTEPIDTLSARAQLQWLETELQKSTARWKIVLGHHTIYSGGAHGDNPELASLLEPLLIRYDVDIYLCGHDHHLELLQPINGVYYIISGAGGKRRDVTWRDNTIYAATNLGFVWFRISRKDIFVEFLRRNSELDYAYVIRK